MTKRRALKERAINIACERIFYKINALSDLRESESHKYYLKLWKVMKTEDKKIGMMPHLTTATDVLFTAHAGVTRFIDLDLSNIISY